MSQHLSRRDFLSAAAGMAVAAALPDEAMAAPVYHLDSDECVQGSVATDEGWMFNYGQPIRRVSDPGHNGVQAYLVGEPHFQATFHGDVYCRALLKEVGYFVVPAEYAADDVILAGISDYCLAVQGNGRCDTPQLRGFASFLRACRRTYLGHDAGQGVLPRPFPGIYRMLNDCLGQLILFDTLPDNTMLAGNDWQRRCGLWLRAEGSFSTLARHPNGITVSGLTEEVERQFKDIFGGDRAKSDSV